eukprot:SAG31_NODE_1089_length_9972_cov_4.602856_9_plen_133_part_00
MKEATSNVEMRNLTDGKILLFVLLLMAVELIPLLIYFTVDGGLVYTTNRCSRTECAAADNVWSVFIAMQAIILGGAIGYAALMSWRTRGADKADGGGDSNVAAALVEAPSVFFCVYNMVFTSLIFYPGEQHR